MFSVRGHSLTARPTSLVLLGLGRDGVWQLLPVLGKLRGGPAAFAPLGRGILVGRHQSCRLQLRDQGHLHNEGIGAEQLLRRPPFRYWPPWAAPRGKRAALRDLPGGLVPCAEPGPRLDLQRDHEEEQATIAQGAGHEDDDGHLDEPLLPPRRNLANGLQSGQHPGHATQVGRHSTHEVHGLADDVVGAVPVDGQRQAHDKAE
mmetsp:Transcript_79443/g.202388  ORF Transcript_79443/g.202388 Transcript_79443/m.202388 type:complete len:203 (-) Transcript_79443:845-1453(-)